MCHATQVRVAAESRPRSFGPSAPRFIDELIEVEDADLRAPHANQVRSATAATAGSHRAGDSQNAPSCKQLIRAWKGSQRVRVACLEPQRACSHRWKVAAIEAVGVAMLLVCTLQSFFGPLLNRNATHLACSSDIQQCVALIVVLSSHAGRVCARVRDDCTPNPSQPQADPARVWRTRAWQRNRGVVARTTVHHAPNKHPQLPWSRRRVRVSGGKAISKPKLRARRITL